MRIRTQFIVAMIISGLVLLIVAVSVLWTNQQIERLNMQEEIAISIERGASELSYLSNDYLLFREDQQRTRWETKWSSISRDLAQLKPSSPEQQIIADNIKANHQRLKAVFDNVASASHDTTRTPAAESVQSFTQVSWSRMAVQNQGIAFDALQLSQVIRDRKDQVRHTNSLLIFVLLGAFSAYFITNYLIVQRRLLASIADLQAGTKVIGSGNLDFALEVKRDDEIGELSHAFNQMTADLKGVTASKAELEVEIAERKAAQQALHAEQERLSVTLGSIGDGVIATDTEANIVLLNGVAEELTGWTLEEAAGRPLLEVFNIINETTREPAEDPVDKALKTGVIVGLANHTALIAKDGTERSIADSCAPIRALDGAIIGAVLVFRDVTEQMRLEAERERLHRQVEDELEISNLLLRAADTLAEPIDLNGVLESLADIVLDVTGSRRIGIYLLDKATHELQAKAARGESAIPVGSKFNLKQLAPQFQSVVYDKQSRVIDYESADVAEENRQRAESLNIKVSLSVPLIYKGDVLGILALDNPGERQNVTERDIELVEGIAAQAAVAIENARLYEAERRIADTLQEALLTVPEGMNGLGYGYMYRSATEGAKVGGDFYDLFELGGGRVGITLGDVSGKGLQAATLTSVVRSTIRAYALDGHCPSKIMAKANEAVRLASGPASFITVFFGLLDTATGKLTYCSAGHPPAILHQAAGVELLREHSPIIGAFAGMSYTEEETYLQKGDSLVLYTDGVTEARHDEEFYGEERLIDFLTQAQEIPVKEIPQAIYNDIVAYSGGKLLDDIAILAISLAGEPRDRY